MFRYGHTCDETVRAIDADNNGKQNKVPCFDELKTFCDKCRLSFFFAALLKEGAGKVDLRLDLSLDLSLDGVWI